jgi:hypothetical protein
MFGRNDIDINGIVVTSKMSLKASCIKVCGNDIERAEKLYDFFAKDIQNLPDFDVPPPSTLEQIKTMAGDVFGWVEQNQDKLIGAYHLIQGFRSGTPIATPGVPPIGIPPIP